MVELVYLIALAPWLLISICLIVLLHRQTTHIQNLYEELRLLKIAASDTQSGRIQSRTTPIQRVPPEFQSPTVHPKIQKIVHRHAAPDRIKELDDVGSIATS